MPSRISNTSRTIASTSGTDDDMRVRRELDRLARILDSSIRLPGGYRIGLDGIVGLVPGIGDALGAAFSLYIVGRAHAMGVPKAVVARMVGNVVLESTVGAVPIVGDLFDFVYKANLRNVALLERYVTDPRRTRRTSRLAVAGVSLLLICALVAVIWAVLAIVGWIAANV